MADTPKRILIVGRDSEDSSRLASLLTNSHYQVSVAEDEANALCTIQEGLVDLVITDHDNESLNGIHLTQQVVQTNAKVKVVMVSRLLDLDTYLQVMNEGCYDCLEAPCKVEDVLRVVERAFEKAAAMQTGMN